jgi:hypothetical protein
VKKYLSLSLLRRLTFIFKKRNAKRVVCRRRRRRRQRRRRRRIGRRFFGKRAEKP